MAVVPPSRRAILCPAGGTLAQRHRGGAAYIAKFLACQDGSGDATDGDGDGFAWCNDCDDRAATVHPGAAEICGNAIDDNCNSMIDATEAAAACPPTTTPPPPAP